MACYLTIKSSPTGATVKINGSTVGTTTVSNYLIQPGTYNIDIRKTGYVAYINLNYKILSTDLAKTLSVTLTPEAEQFAWLTIKSNPTGATVYVDGYNKGTEPKTIQESPLSKHDIELRKSGYGDYTYDNYTWPAAGVTKSVTFTLPALPITAISINSNPTGALIYIDGANTTKLTPSQIEVSAGYHTIKLTKSGYYDYTATENVPEGTILLRNYTLTAIPILPSINETIGWEASVPSGSHNFYLFSLYGTNTNNTIGGFQISQGAYKIVSTLSISRQDNITTSSVSKNDCLTIIAENYDGSTISGIYDAWIQSSVI